MDAPKSGTVTLRPEVQSAIEEIVAKAIGATTVAAATPVPAVPSSAPLATMAQAPRTVTQDGAPVADMEMRLSSSVDSLNKIGGLGVVGSILFGAVPGAIVGEVIDGLVPPRSSGGQINLTNVAVKGAAMYVGVKWGKRYVGSQAAGFFAGAIGLQIAADVLPLDRWVDAVVGKLGGLRIPGLAGAGNYGSASHAQAENTIVSPATGRYSAAFGG